MQFRWDIKEIGRHRKALYGDGKKLGNCQWIPAVFARNVKEAPAIKKKTKQKDWGINSQTFRQLSTHCLHSASVGGLEWELQNIRRQNMHLLNHKRKSSIPGKNSLCTSAKTITMYSKCQNTITWLPPLSTDSCQQKVISAPCAA